MTIEDDRNKPGNNFSEGIYVEPLEPVNTPIAIHEIPEVILTGTGIGMDCTMPVEIVDTTEDGEEHVAGTGLASANLLIAPTLFAGNDAFPGALTMNLSVPEEGSNFQMISFSNMSVRITGETSLLLEFDTPAEEGAIRFQLGLTNVTNIKRHDGFRPAAQPPPQQ